MGFFIVIIAISLIRAAGWLPLIKRAIEENEKDTH